MRAAVREPLDVAVVKRKLADNLVRQRREADALGAAPDSYLRRAIEFGRRLNWFLKRESTPMDPDHYNALRVVAYKQVFKPEQARHVNGGSVCGSEIHTDLSRVNLAEAHYDMAADAHDRRGILPKRLAERLTVKQQFMGDLVLMGADHTPRISVAEYDALDATAENLTDMVSLMRGTF